MDQDRVLVEFLKGSKQNISDFVEKNESDKNLEELLGTTKQISKCVDSLINFITPCFSEYSDSSIKKYEDCVYINRNVNCENEIASLLQQIQNESSDFLSFLENLQIIFNSFYLVNSKFDPKSVRYKSVDGCKLNDNLKSVDKTNILSLYNENGLLASELDKLKDQMGKNENKLAELDNVKEKCTNELNRCIEVLSSFSKLELDNNNLNNK